MCQGLKCTLVKIFFSEKIVFILYFPLDFLQSSHSKVTMKPRFRLNQPRNAVAQRSKSFIRTGSDDRRPRYRVSRAKSCVKSGRRKGDISVFEAALIRSERLVQPLHQVRYYLGGTVYVQGNFHGWYAGGFVLAGVISPFCALSYPYEGFSLVSAGRGFCPRGHPRFGCRKERGAETMRSWKMYPPRSNPRR